MKKLAGLIPPAVTIFDENGCADYDAMKKHADYMIAGCVDGIAYLGTSGEFSVMTQEQKKELIRTMIPYIKGRVQAVAGIGDTCLANSLELAAEANAAGADGVLAVIPYFSIYGEENVEAYYKELAEQIKLPILVYNFPALTGFDMNTRLMNRLAEQCPAIVGIKDTVPDTKHLKEMLLIKKKRPDFSVFCAYEDQAWEMAQAGVDGFINATANFAPQITAGFLKAVKKHDRQGMETAFHKMEEAAQVYQYGTPLLLAVKEAVYQKVLGKRGFEMLPGLPIKEEDRNRIKTILSNL